MHLDPLRCLFPSSRGLLTYYVQMVDKTVCARNPNAQPIRTTRSLTLRQSDQAKPRGELFTFHHRSPPKLFGVCVLACLPCLLICGLCCGQPTRETQTRAKTTTHYLLYTFIHTKSYDFVRVLVLLVLLLCCTWKIENRSHHTQVRTIDTFSYRLALQQYYWVCTYYVRFRRAAEKLHEKKADGETRDKRHEKTSKKSWLLLVCT